jgi:hypothetical protein
MSDKNLEQPINIKKKTQGTNANVDKVRNVVSSDRRSGVKLIAEEGCGNLLGGKDPNSGVTSEFSTMNAPAHDSL